MILTGVASLLTVSCEKEENPYKNLSYEQLRTRITERYEEILLFAHPEACTDPDEWRLAEIMSVCGRGHIAYHGSVDEKKLQALIKDHNLLVEIYAPMVAPVIDCMPYRQPIGITCVDGEATVEYNPFDSAEQG